MTGDAADLLAQLPAWAFGFMLLLARTGCACMLLPGIGEMELPATVRAGFTIALTVALLPVVAPLIPPMPADVWRCALMVAAEVITGLWFGWLTRLMLLAMPLAGQITASVTGQTNVMQPDPALGPQTAVLSTLLAKAATVLVLATGLHALPFIALAGSYDLIPPGTLLPAADTADQVTRALADAFGLALRLASPFVLAHLVWQSGLGVLSRLVPQMQVYFAAAPGQIVMGLALLAVLSSTLLSVWRDYLQAHLSTLPGL